MNFQLQNQEDIVTISDLQSSVLFSHGFLQITQACHFGPAAPPLQVVVAFPRWNWRAMKWGNRWEVVSRLGFMNLQPQFLKTLRDLGPKELLLWSHLWRWRWWFSCNFFFADGQALKIIYSSLNDELYE